MDLCGWNYMGRNIGVNLHRQFRIMIDCLKDSAFVDGRTWGDDLEKSLAHKMGMASPGQVRTVKTTCEKFGFTNRAGFNSKVIPNADNILTGLGQIVYNAAVLEAAIESNNSLTSAQKQQATYEISKMYEEAYCDKLKSYYFINKNGTKLCPLRAALRALEKYEKLDKWEWYLLNTFIMEDDNENQEAELHRHIELYRAGGLKLSMKNVKTKRKGHQYFPQYMDFAGLACLVKRPVWSISVSDRHDDVKAEVLAEGYLKSLYGC